MSNESFVAFSELLVGGKKISSNNELKSKSYQLYFAEFEILLCHTTNTSVIVTKLYLMREYNNN